MMTEPSAGAKTRRLADSQHGVITGEQAISAGLSRYMIRRKVRLREWEPLGKDTYLVHGPRSSMAYLWAAVLGLQAVVSHESAAQLHGLGGPPFTGAVATVPSRRTYSFAGVKVHQSTDLIQKYVTEIGGLPVTTTARTMFDLASVTETEQLGDIVQKALARRKVTIGALTVVLNELGRRGRPGTGRFRDVLQAVSPGRATPESVMEERMIALLNERGLPMPTLLMVIEVPQFRSLKFPTPL